MNIKKKYLCVVILSIVSAVIMTACNSEASGHKAESAIPAGDEVTEDTVEENEAGEDAASEEAAQKYSINETSIDDSTNGNGSEYEISDMLPKPSDDTRIMSVEEAMKLMGKNPDGTDIEDGSSDTD